MAARKSKKTPTQILRAQRLKRSGQQSTAAELRRILAKRKSKKK